MLKRSLLLLSVLMIVVVFGCNNQTSDNRSLKEIAFTERYPGKKVKSWSKVDSIDVAHFKINRNESEAWFTASGWQMTITNISPDCLSPKVKEAMDSSFFSDWDKTACRRVGRNHRQTIEIVSVERNMVKYDFFYNLDGVIYRTVNITQHTPQLSKLLPQAVPDIVSETLQEVHPGAVIFETDCAGDIYELDVVHGSKGIHVVISTDNGWIQSATEINGKANLPEAVCAAKSSKYADCMVENVTFIQCPEYECYEIVMTDKNGYTLEAHISPRGEIIEHQ